MENSDSNGSHSSHFEGGWLVMVVQSESPKSKSPSCSWQSREKTKRDPSLTPAPRFGRNRSDSEPSLSEKGIFFDIFG